MGHKGRKLKIDKDESKQNNEACLVAPQIRVVWTQKNTNANDPITNSEFNDSSDARDNHGIKCRKTWSNAYTKWWKRQQGPWFSICANSLLTKLPLLRDCKNSERESLLIQKIRQCCVVFDFVTDPPCYEKLKEAKRNTLTELVSYVSTFRKVFTEVVYTEAFNMFVVNISRPLPMPKPRDFLVYELDEEDIQLEPAWPHLELVYKLFLEFLDSPDFVRVAQRFVSRSFTHKLLELFDSEDPRERKYLSVILQKIYTTVINLRPFVRKGINDILYTFIYETESHNGIADLLEVVKCIIRGYIVPLREENKILFSTVLLPLHKSSSMTVYFEELQYCVLQFLKKDRTLADPLVKYLVSHWPKTNSLKEAKFLDEISVVLSCSDPQQVRKYINPLIKQLNKCCSSFNSSVSEKAMLIRNCLQTNLGEESFRI